MRGNKKEALKPVSEKQTPPFLCLLLISCTSRLPSFTPSSSFTRMHKAESRQHTNTTICRKEGGWKRNSASHVVCVCLSWHHDKHCWQIRVRPVSVLTSLKKNLSLTNRNNKGREPAQSQFDSVLGVSLTKYLSLIVIQNHTGKCVFLCSHGPAPWELSHVFTCVRVTCVVVHAAWLGALTALEASSALGFLSLFQNLGHE